MDILLVGLAIAGAMSYLCYRVVRSRRHAERDWSTGKAQACSSCPVVEIRKLQLEKRPPAR
ncbi:hypothetical protein HZB60_10975 [candidate division KSB1 bacterium]|nr:hypothetical protein [candidate division KSB1 bacterium]